MHRPVSAGDIVVQPGRYGEILAVALQRFQQFGCLVFRASCFRKKCVRQLPAHLRAPVARLPGSVSAAKDLSSLFERFVGSTCSSDSPLAFMLVVRLIAFSSRSALLLPDTNGVSRFSRMRFPDMPGVCDCAGLQVARVFRHS